jgi:hypothetical protein
LTITRSRIQYPNERMGVFLASNVSSVGTAS